MQKRNSEYTTSLLWKKNKLQSKKYSDCTKLSIQISIKHKRGKPEI